MKKKEFLKMVDEKIAEILKLVDDKKVSSKKS